MPAGDNPHSISEKKAALRELPKGPKNDVNEQPRTSFPKDKADDMVGIKRPQPNGPLSPTNHHMLGNPGSTGHLVYVRRRLETDQSKGGTSASAESVSSLSSKKTVIGGLQEQSLKHQNSLQAYHSFGKQSPGKVVVQPSIVVTASPPPRNAMSATTVPWNFVAASVAPCNIVATSTASRDAVVTSPACNPADLQRSSDQDWKERFIRLQAFLRNNEQSGQEEYIHMLRSLSSAGRSKHAIELENRAVNLLIEEGKELQKMKVLNVLGKLSPTDHPSLPPQPSSAMHLPLPPSR